MNKQEFIKGIMPSIPDSVINCEAIAIIKLDNSTLLIGFKRKLIKMKKRGPLKNRKIRINTTEIKEVKNEY